jgi:hypothetical protein
MIFETISMETSLINGVILEIAKTEAYIYGGIADPGDDQLWITERKEHG